MAWYYTKVGWMLYNWDGGNVVYLVVNELNRLEYFYRYEEDILCDEDKNRIIQEIRDARLVGEELIQYMNGEVVNAYMRKYNISVDNLSLENLYRPPTEEDRRMDLMQDEMEAEYEKLKDEFFNRLKKFDDWWD